MKKPELLSPAGNMECLYAAINAGADAIYIGGKHFGARAFADNFTDEEIIEAINYCHLVGVKLYVTVNTMITEELVNPFIKYIDFLHKNNIDAVIISDLGMIDYLRQVYPNLEIHASTQMHIHNLEGANFISKLGVRRVVLARETDIDLLKKIKNNSNIELEVFVHGALCISYSGQCLMSSLIGGRSGNKGTCAQSCRMKYCLLHDNEIIDKNYLLSTKDLNTLEHIGELIDLGIDSFKIEGRMKSKEYVYLVTKLYRKAIDSYIKDKKINIKDEDIIDLKKVFNRDYTKGFLFNEDNNNFTNSFRPNHIGVKLGKVISINNNLVKIKLEDNINIKDGIRFLNKDEDYGMTVFKMKKNGNYVEKSSKGDIVEIKVDKKVDLNSKVVKTTDYNLVNCVDEEIKLSKKKIKISGIIECRKNEPIMLKIMDDSNSVEIKSDNLIEESINRPITNEEIRKQIEKLGNTVYEFNDLKVICDNDIFINLKELNDIRRKAVEELNNKRLYSTLYKKESYNNLVNEYKEDKGYTYLIYDEDTYKKIKDKAKEIIIEDLNLYNDLSLDSKVILKIPRVIYEYPKYDNKVLIGECGSIDMYKDKVSDFSFNVSNSYTVAFLHNQNIKRVTLSIELNKLQIKKLIDNYKERYNKLPNVEVIVSSVPEAMVCKYNLIKKYNLNGNDNYLVDKFKNKFPIKIKNNLMYIYHYKKIEFDDYEELFKYGVNTLRIDCN